MFSSTPSQTNHGPKHATSSVRGRARRSFSSLGRLFFLSTIHAPRRLSRTLPLPADPTATKLDARRRSWRRPCDQLRPLFLRVSTSWVCMTKGCYTLICVYTCICNSLPKKQVPILPNMRFGSAYSQPTRLGPSKTCKVIRSGIGIEGSPSTSSTPSASCMFN